MNQTYNKLPGVVLTGDTRMTGIPAKKPTVAEDLETGTVHHLPARLPDWAVRLTPHPAGDDFPEAAYAVMLYYGGYPLKPELQPVSRAPDFAEAWESGRLIAWSAQLHSECDHARRLSEITCPTPTDSGTWFVINRQLPGETLKDWWLIATYSEDGYKMLCRSYEISDLAAPTICAAFRAGQDVTKEYSPREQ